MYNIFVTIIEILQISYRWPVRDHTLYTFMVYDADSSDSPYIHYLATYVPGTKLGIGIQTIPFASILSRKLQPIHRFVVAVFEQPSTVRVQSSRSNFNMKKFVEEHQLSLEAELTIVVESENNTFYVIGEPSQNVTFNPEHPLILTNTTLTEGEQKFCSCVVDVAAKQPAACNVERLSYEERDHRMCYNAYRVCARSTGTSSRLCDANYNYEAFIDIQLVSLGSLKGIVEHLSRAELIAHLREKAY